MKKFFPLALAALFIGLGVILRGQMPKPYVWILTFPVFAAALACLAVFVKVALVRYVLLGLMSIFVAFGVFEAYLCLGERAQEDSHMRSVPIEELRKEKNRPDLQEHQSNITYNDPVLGYRPKPMRVQTATRVLYDDTVVYDAIYSTLDSGWRITPQHPDAEHAVVMFGCSYVFGYGLNDEETLPYKLGVKLGENYQVYNLSFSGYGSHHMLAQIQDDMLAEIAKRHKTLSVFFLTIDGHEFRSAGFSTWDKRGPWYELENGQVVHKGRFTDRHNAVFRALNRFLRNSLAYQSLTEARQDDRKKYAELHLAIINQADQDLRQRYGTKLVTILWPRAEFFDALKKKGSPILDLLPHFPDYGQGDKYTIPHDGHPNPLATEIAAEAVAGYVRQSVE